MKSRDFTVILAAAALALVLLILSRSGLLQPKTAPQNQTAADISVIKQIDGQSSQTGEVVPLWNEGSKRLPSSAYLRVSVNNRMYEPIPLDDNFSLEIRREGGYHNLLIAENGVVSMMFSTCDNQQCVHQGEVSLENRDLRALYNQIICLPNEVLLEVFDEGEMMSLYGEQTLEAAARPYALATIYSAACLMVMFFLRFGLRLILINRRVA